MHRPRLSRMMRLARRFGLLLIVAGFALGARGYWNATRDPIIRTANVAVADWPKDAPPLKLILISDVHVAGPDMPPERVRRIAALLNAHKPDLVLIAGDLVSEKRLATHIYTAPEVIAPLKALNARYGVVIAMGNHDHWFDANGIEKAAAQAGLTLVRNGAVQRGPITVGAVDDDYTGRADLPKTFAAMDALTGPRILLTHSPDVAAELPSPVAAVLAGHTHCGQIINPLTGKPVSFVSHHGMRFNCGDITDGQQRVFVTAGLGTSIIWMRYGAPPDAWVVTLGP